MKSNLIKKGQLIKERYVTLSSFLGSFIQEIVPFTNSDWRKVHLKMENIICNCVQVSFNIMISIQNYETYFLYNVYFISYAFLYYS